MNTVREFSDVAAEPAVRGFLHEPARPNTDALVLTHGAGANCQSKLLTAVANAFAEAPTKDKAAFDRLSDGQKKGFHPATTKDWDATIELIKFVDNLRKKKAS